MKLPRSALIGSAVWIVLALWTVRDLRGFAWSAALVPLAALVIVPLVLELARSGPHSVAVGRWLEGMVRLQLPAALVLTIGCQLAPGFGAALLALPWVAFTAGIAVIGGRRILERGVGPVPALVREMGMLFLVIGGAWTFADRSGLRPLDFGTDIVQLTAVHFHFAGFALPIIAARVLREYPDSLVGRLAGIGILAGVPLVAAGITAAQFGYGTGGELFAAAVLAPSGGIIAVLQLRCALRDGFGSGSRVLLVVASVSLLFGMTLALLYAMRGHFAPWPWLDIPWMRALHGTANALGFTLCAAVAWVRIDRTVA